MKNLRMTNMDKAEMTVQRKLDITRLQNAIDGLKTTPQWFKDDETKQLISELRNQQIDLMIINNA